ncbi:homocysteine S-methyltransferase family protein [Leeia sp. TBRC 13508]|uniref:Homocysteine S-methyltransferase family protein n=1 Tax=Leeia speluncae TaxID=2884804 RepID=A0ABS8D955_9NEIS|nr:homocysteine S-methyltransferase family protein [Leeia speluncae]MCB6184158.1 homocysteine S-methyltransferase family protein [Leeia speluncae]
MAQTVKILDGGMGRELNRIGAPFRQPEWSALALMEGPAYVGQVHDAFINNGAEIITTNSYAVVPFHIGDERFEANGEQLAALAGQLARESANKAGHPVMVAGSLSPALGSYRPDLFVEADSIRIHQTLIRGLDAYVDVWLAETQSSIAEIRAAHTALAGNSKPFWVSFTLDDEFPGEDVQLRSGESVAEAVKAALALGVKAVLFNCSQPEVMASAVKAARAEIANAGVSVEVGVYANAFPPQPKDAEANSGLDELRADLDPPHYLVWAQRWVEAGASIVGGCCGISPEHIGELAKAFHPK